MPSIEDLQAALGYEFNKYDLMVEAITHPSLLKKKRVNTLKAYERLEFLGDSVLGLVVAEMLLKEFPTESEGELARRHANLVNGVTVSTVARDIGISKYILMSDGEEAGGGRDNSANLEDVLEALIAAIYLDGGLDEAKKFISRHWLPVLQRVATPPKDAKSALQEWAQGRGLPLPLYAVVSEDGPAHAPTFTVSVKLNSYGEASAIGKSKKIAELLAAEKLLESLEKTGNLAVKG